MRAMRAIVSRPRPEPRVHHAVLGDLPALERFIASHTGDGTLLPRSRPNLVQHIRDFRVVRAGGEIVGCGALQIVNATLGEVRSVAVQPEWRGGGLGSRIVTELMHDALRLGMQRVFCLTRRQDFFARLGFEVVARERFPHKIWSDCRLCPRQAWCDEIAMQRFVPGILARTTAPASTGAARAAAPRLRVRRAPGATPGVRQRVTGETAS